MRTKSLHDELGIKDAYKLYRSDTTKDEKVLYDEYRRICYAVNAKIAEKLLCGKQIKLPFNIGRIFIRKVRNNFKHLKFDYAHFNKTGEKAFHLNIHSNKFHAKWFWEKISCRIPGNKIYSFIPSRDNKRSLSKVMQQPGEYKRYLE
jgi:hypothetical protein